MPVARIAGAEPLPGYRLIEPLGSGGFGEAWKCLVPGGFQKAIKFVHGNLDSMDGGGNGARQELEALQHIKAIRHPFLLSTERVEIVAGELMIVTELADQNLHDRLEQCQAEGLPGIPRDELLSLLLEAAEALDWMNFQHGLQHLDIKPRNLFLVSGHVKVADFGLVISMAGREANASPEEYRGGTTPLYAPPEILKGLLSRHCDQYSLAIVYQQLVTGVMPFSGKNARQLMVQHLTQTPDVSPLGEEDRAPVARALSKDPDARFPSCLDFLRALVCGPNSAPSSVRIKGSSVQRPAVVPRRPPELVPHVEDTAPARTPPTRQVRRVAEVQPTPVSSRIEQKTDGPVPPSPAPARSAETAVPAPIIDAIEGYDLVGCLGAGSLGAVWSVRSADGREQLARVLTGLIGDETKLAARLGALKHPGLPPTRVVRTVAGRVALITDPFEQTLQDRYHECSAQSLPGIPRQELLDLLRPIAETLDELRERFGLRHLGLNPRCILLENGEALLSDFGLVELVWLPTGHAAAELNPRYAAPELTDAGSKVSGDPYSLALIYAEMLSGIHPRPARRHARGRPDRRSEKLELDLLPATDRELLARALHSDPELRFTSCTELIEALDDASRRCRDGDARPPVKPAQVLPIARLKGGTEAAIPAVPSVVELVKHFIPPGAMDAKLCEFASFRYLLRGAAVAEHLCLIRQLPPDMLRLKLKAFRQRWRAAPVLQDPECYRFHIKTPSTLWQRCVGSEEAGVEIEVHVRALPGVGPQLAEARILIQPFGAYGDRHIAMVQEFAPHLIESLRHSLGVAQDRRAEERWPIEQPVSVFPLSSDRRETHGIVGVSEDLSQGGIRFRVPERLPSEQVYVQLDAKDGSVPFAILARVVRVEPCGDGWFEVGAAFHLDSANEEATPGRVEQIA